MANYSEPVAIDAVMRAIAVGEVVASRSDDIPEGAFVTGMLGWQDYAVVPAKALRAVDPGDLPPAVARGYPRKAGTKKPRPPKRTGLNH